MEANRIYNFNPGPATLPLDVLKEAQAEFLNFRNSGMSILEISHRAKAYDEVHNQAKADILSLMGLGDDYDVLFVQGGASLAFAMVAMNYATKEKKGSYVLSGSFATKAYDEAALLGVGEIAASSKDGGFRHVPTQAEIKLDPNAAYLHLCYNNTIYGTEYHYIPETGEVPLFADMSSDMLSRPLDFKKFSFIYAGVQKNAGPAGVTVVIVRDDLVQDGPALGVCPSYMDFRLEAERGSMLNTPNCWGIYVCGKVFHWIEDQGGLKAMGRSNWDKVRLLYDYLDQSDLFCGTVRARDRSIANVTFRTTSPELDDAFVEAAAERGIVNVRGHRLVGGMRASCYNAVSPASVQELVTCMADFEATHAGAAPENATRAGATPTQVTSGSPTDPKGVRSG